MISLDTNLILAALQSLGVRLHLRLDRYTA